MEELVSICVPVYNTEKYIDDCINSILKQSYNNIEILFNDDGSTDNSLSLIKKIALLDNRIKYISNNNQGLSEARNRLIEIANGKYLMFIDSDDVIEKDTVLDFVSFCDNNSLSLCGFAVDYINENYSIKTNFKQDKFSSLSEKIYYCDKIGILNSACNKFYSNEIIKKFNLRFNKDVKQCEDIDFNFRYLKHVDNIIIVPKTNYHYRKFDIGSEVNSYRENIVEITKLGIDIKNSLYKYYQLKSDEQLDFLIKDNIDVLNYCLINTINYSKNRTRKSIYDIIEFVYNFADNLCFNRKINNLNLYQKIFIFYYKIRSCSLTFISYKLLLCLRHKFKKIYYIFRKNALKK